MGSPFTRNPNASLRDGSVRRIRKRQELAPGKERLPESEILRVIIDGKTVVEGNRFLGVDEAEPLSTVQAEAEMIWAKIPEWDVMGRSAEEISPWAFPLKPCQ
jgi:hypothetical protein